MIYDPKSETQRLPPIKVPIPPALRRPRFPLAEWGKKVYGFSVDGGPHLNLTVHLAPEGFIYRGICTLCGHRHEVLLDLRGLAQAVTPEPHVFADRVLSRGLSAWAVDHSQCRTRPAVLEIPAVVEAAHDEMVGRAREQLSRGEIPGRYVALIYEDQDVEMLVPNVPEVEELFAAQDLLITECLNAFARNLRRDGRSYVAACVQVHVPTFVRGIPQEDPAAILIGTVTADAAVVDQLPITRRATPGDTGTMIPMLTMHPAFAGLVMKRTIDATQPR